MKGMQDDHAPYVLYKMDISYFSGKLEAYMRYKQIPFTTVTATAQVLNDLYRCTGVKKVPAVRTADGLWLFDTTPTIRWFEERYSQRPATPEDPALAFIARLIEDYADEWLWRPAMWWRWEPVPTRKALGWRIAQEVDPAGIPDWLMAWFFPWRQRYTWLWGDGMNKQNSAQVRDLYLQELEQLDAVLQGSPYLLGQQPSLADFGYFASMFRHFGNDPDPAEIMRREAPSVYSWTARLWQGAKDVESTKQAQWNAFDGTKLWRPLMQRISHDYLPYLQQNAAAFAAGKKRFDYRGGSVQFPSTVTHHYRVWCLSQLQKDRNKLPADAQECVSSFLSPSATGILGAADTVSSGLDALYDLPRPAGNYKPSLLTALLGQARN